MLLLGEVHLAVVGALDGSDARGDGHGVLVRADLGQGLAAGKAASQRLGVVEGVPDPLGRCGEGSGSGDLHAVGSWLGDVV